MKYLLIILVSILCGCTSYRYESFAFNRYSPSNEMQAIAQIKDSGKETKGIPFLFTRETKGAPYHLELCFMSEIKPTDPVTLTKVTFTNTEGQTHDLLSKEASISSFRKINLGPYIRKERFEAMWISFSLPLKFIDQRTCTVEVEFIFKGKVCTKKSVIGTRLDKGLTNIISEILKY